MSASYDPNCQLPEGETPGNKKFAHPPYTTYQWHRAVKDMMTGNKQVPYNCGSARGNKTFICHSE